MTRQQTKATCRHLIRATHAAMMVLTLWAISVPAVLADVASDMTAFVDQAGGASTATPPSIYQGQSRGYINGGRLFVRVPQRTTQFLAYKAPKVTAGCGGIDIYGGSMSYISATELVDTLRAAGTSAIGSYALMLGIRTVSSQIANTVEEVFGWLKDKIGNDISSCEAAANIVGAGMEFMGINDREKNLCIIRTMEATGVEYSKAKAQCFGGGTKNRLNDPEVKKLSFSDGNLVWRILHKNQMFAGDNEMKFLAMSLTGTIVKRQVKTVAGAETTVPADADSQSKTDYYPSLLHTDGGLIDALLYGATVTRYTCADNLSSEYGCKDITTSSWTLNSADGLVSRTRAALMRLYTAVRNRTDPTPGDADFVGRSNMPAMRIVRTAALLGDHGLGTQIIDDYAEQIAVELLSTYVASIARSVSAYSYQAGLGEDGEKLRESIGEVLAELRDIREAAGVSLNNSMRIAEQMQYYERILISALPNNITRSLDWSAGGGR